MFRANTGSAGTEAQTLGISVIISSRTSTHAKRLNKQCTCLKGKQPGESSRGIYSDLVIEEPLSVPWWPTT